MEYVIVGGGVSGLYAAYRLCKREDTAQVTIVEALDRVGGRVLTDKIGDHVLEYGPMRFEPELQRTFANLLKELNICTKAFVPYTCPIDPPDFNQIFYEEIKAIRKYSTLSPAFALLKYALREILDDQWNVEADSIYDPSRDARKKWLKKYGVFQGRLLRDHGLWDTLAHVLSKEALDYLQHKGTFYHMLSINPNAADQICFMLDILATAKDNLITIENGSQEIVNKLYNNLCESSKTTFVMSTQVTSFKDTQSSKKINVYTFGCGKEKDRVEGQLTCDHLIFTCQKNAYSYITGFPEHIRNLFDSVMVVKLFKIFIILENPPFSNPPPSPNYNADKVPCREIHYSYSDKDNTGMVMIYGDIPSLNYWKPFTGSKDTHMKNHLVHYLRQIFPGATEPYSISYFNILDWSNEPHRSGVHLWRPGCTSSDVIKQMSSFGKNKNTHICGETYSDYQGFIEGCLRTVNTVLLKI